MRTFRSNRYRSGAAAKGSEIEQARPFHRAVIEDQIRLPRIPFEGGRLSAENLIFSAPAVPLACLRLKQPPMEVGTDHRLADAQICVALLASTSTALSNPSIQHRSISSAPDTGESTAQDPFGIGSRGNLECTALIRDLPYTLIKGGGGTPAGPE